MERAKSEAEKPQNDVVASRLSSMLSTLTRDYDSKAEDALRSQHSLSSALDRLTSELDQLLEDVPVPFIIQYAGKVSSVRRRVSSMNSLLKSIHRRLDNMDQMLSQTMLHDEKAATECSEQQLSVKLKFVLEFVHSVTEEVGNLFYISTFFVVSRLSYK